MKLEIEVPSLPEESGFEYTGELREPRPGEWFLSIYGEEPQKAGQTTRLSLRLILRKKRWRANNELRYYCYVENNGDIFTIEDYQDYLDNSRYEKGNYFRTKEEAKASKFYKVFHQKEEL